LGELRWQLHVHDEVGGVTSGGQGSCSAQDLVDWAHVDTRIWLFSVLFGKEPKHWKLCVELLWLRVIQEVSSVVPSSTFKIHTVGKDSIFWGLSNLVVSNFVINLKLKVKLINGNDVLSGIVLKSSSEESLWEEES